MAARRRRRDIDVVYGSAERFYFRPDCQKLGKLWRGHRRGDRSHEQPISRLNSNLDKNLIDVLSARKSISSLEPADNAVLGLARAISAANILRANKSLSPAEWFAQLSHDVLTAY